MQIKLVGSLALAALIIPTAVAAATVPTPFTVGSASSTVPVLSVTDAGVGIGSTAPSSSLHIEGSMPVVTLKKSMVNQAWQLRAGGLGQFSSGFDLYNANKKQTALFVATDGNLSVGTSSSNINSRLYVWGGPTGANIDVRGDERIYGGDQATIELEGWDYDSIPNSAMLQYYGSKGVGSVMGFPSNRLGHLQFGGASVGIIHTTDAAPLVFGTKNIERMRIDADGKVGIGVKTPQSLFHVSAGAAATTTISVGELSAPDSKSCVNMKSTAGTPISFYFNAAGSMVVEQNYCR